MLQEDVVILRPAHTQRLMPWAVQGLKIAISGGLLWLLFSRIDVMRFWEAARQASMTWLGIALVAYTSVVLASSWRWHQLLAMQNVRIRRRTVTQSFLVSLFFNNFLPSNIGGDVIRVRDTARAAGSHTRAFTVIVADRVAGLLALMTFAAGGGAVAATARLPFSVIWIWLALAAGLGGTVLALLVPSLLARALASIGLAQSWAGRQIVGFVESAENFRLAPARLIGTLLMSLFIQGAFIGVYAAMAKALGVPVGFVQLALIVPLAGLIQLLPISINGFGIREATFTLLFGRFGVGPDAALLVSLEATVLMLAFSLLGAAVYILRANESQSAETGA